MSNETDKPKISCAENGPYIVMGLGDLRDVTGSAVPAAAKIALCRCGGSNNKPFCDGTHTKIGFDGTKKADRTPDRRKTYEGKKVSIHDNRALCAHAGVCTDRLPSVWRMHEQRWINPDAADVTAIIEVIDQCPSGALSYSIDGEVQKDANRAPSIQVTADGPYKVTGAVEFVGEEWGEGASREHYTLCRCGGSKNKPFCDGSHWNIGFKDDATS